MTKPKHLPECFNGRQRSGGLPCICDRLRACEQRVERRIDFMLAKAHDYGERTGHAAGVQAARDAVAAYADERLVVTKHPNMSEDITAALRVAVARIDALRGEPT